MGSWSITLMITSSTLTSAGYTSVGPSAHFCRMEWKGNRTFEIEIERTPATRHPLLSTRHPLPVTRHPSPATRHPSPVTRHLPPATRGKDLPCRDCKRVLKNFRHVRWKCQSFSKLANTTSRQSFLLEGLNRFSLDKYPSFWEKLPSFVLNGHWQTQQFLDAIPLHFSSRKKLPCWL